MIVADTNILVRIVTADDADQTARAAQLFEQQEVFIPLTVVLELDWVLRSRYRYSEINAVEAFVSLAGIPTVTVEHHDRVDRALHLTRKGMDFADALHLAAAEAHDGFVTFDRALARLAGREGVRNVELL